MRMRALRILSLCSSFIVLASACSDGDNGGGGPIGPGNRAPAITSPTTINISDADENPLFTVAASDPDGDRVRFSIEGGDDAGLFDIDATTGAVSASQRLSFERPADANGDNVYLFDVRASDGSSSVTRTLTLRVSNTSPASLLRLIGAADGDEVGADVAFIPDIDGDGVPEIAVGEPNTILNDTDDVFGYVILSSGLVGGGEDLSPDDVVGGRGFRIASPNLSELDSVDVSRGFAITSAGDVNNDGVGDILVTAPGALIAQAQAQPGNNFNDTSAFLIFGSSADAIGTNTLDITRASPRVVRIILPRNYNGGSSDLTLLPVHAGGHDLDGDGRDEIAIAARDPDAPGTSNRVFVIDGASLAAELNSDQRLTLNAANVGTDHYVIEQPAGDLTLTQIAMTRDADDDGSPDFGLNFRRSGAIFLSGAAVLNDANGVIEIDPLLGSQAAFFEGFVSTNQINGQPVTRQAGTTETTFIRDIDNDGADELAVVLTSEDIDPNPNARDPWNTVQIVSSSFLSNPSNIPTTPRPIGGGVDIELVDIIPSFRRATTVRSIGDLDNDGRDEILIAGEEVFSQNGTGERFYIADIVFGDTLDAFSGRTLDLRDLDEGNSICLIWDNIGPVGLNEPSIASTGEDINGDGVDDFLIGIPGAFGGDVGIFENELGAAYLVSGDAIAAARITGRNVFIVD